MKSAYLCVIVAMLCNFITIVGMNHTYTLWKKGQFLTVHAWLVYGAVAMTIVACQFLLVAARFTEQMSLTGAIALNIAAVLCVIAFLEARRSQRLPSLTELAFGALLVVAAYCLMKSTGRAISAENHEPSSATPSAKIDP